MCLLLWQSETAILPVSPTQRVEERYEVLVCQDTNQHGERFLELRRITAWKGFENDPLRIITELRLPWGAVTTSEKP